MSTEAQDRVQALADIFGALPVTNEQIRQWLDERGIPVFVGAGTLFDEVRRSFMPAIEKLLDELFAASHSTQPGEETTDV